MTREDRSKKLKDRKSNSETVVKCCLKKLIRSNKPDVVKAIKSHVEAYSKRTHLASIVVNLVVKEAFDGVPDGALPNVAVPPIADHTFIRQAMLGTEGANQPYPEVASIYSRYQELGAKLALLKRHPADRNIYSAGSKKYLTNLKNHLVLNLLRFMKRILYSKYFEKQLTASNIPVREAIKAMLYDLNGWKGVYNRDLLAQLPTNIQTSFNLQKQILGDDPINKQWLKSDDNLYRMVRYFVYANRFLDSQGEKLFNLLPISSMRSHFITIDTHSLYGVASDAGLIDVKKCNRDAFIKLGKEHWGSILDSQLVAGNGKAFTGTIETDGAAICVHFTQRKPTIASGTKLIQGFKADPNVDVVGIDPGRSNILYAVKLMNGTPKAYKLTRSQYYRESGIREGGKLSQ
jgi:hypothetical protein